MTCVPGEILYGTYRILDILGKGGNGTVYLARHERSGRLWAVKEIVKEENHLIMEAELLKKLRHPGLPAVGDILEQNGMLYLVMDYIEGYSLKELLEKEGVCSQEQVAKWGLQLCQVLEYLHTRIPSVIYRDMKPSNIMQREDGTLVLVDFGTAREQKEEASGDTVWLGTRGYAAPEQYGGHGQTGPETDIYGLGAVLYHLLTGRSPADPPYGFVPVRTLRPEISGGLEKVLWCCTRDDPGERYHSCRELSWALTHYRELDEEFIRRKKRRNLIFALCLAVTVAAFTGSRIMAFLEQRAVADTYRARISEAEGAIGVENRLEACKRAIFLEPGLAEGYRCLLHIFLEDGVFSVEEELIFREILNGRQDGGKSSLEQLQAEVEEYQSAAYEIGQAYFYDYEGVDGKRASARWLLAAAGAATGTGLSEQEIFRAEILSKIAGYYQGLDVQKRNGDTEASYEEYWTDMETLCSQELEERDNRITALLADRELTAGVALRAEQFKKAGIDSARMENMLSEIQGRLFKWKQEENSEYEWYLMQEVEDGLLTAKQAVEAAFSEIQGAF
ncbi:MAG: serine/threonine protein kinase [Lachnospiraceae bacterium]|nr:serine/threonine protein kinase [Lachnospiraceae bacterium]